MIIVDEQLQAYINYLAQCMSICDKLDELLKEDSEEVHSAIHGEAEKHYRKACAQAAKELSDIKKQLNILYSEACTGLI